MQKANKISNPGLEYGVRSGGFIPQMSKNYFDLEEGPANFLRPA
jgi:hypothetical protein